MPPKNSATPDRLDGCRSLRVGAGSTSRRATLIGRSIAARPAASPRLAGRLAAAGVFQFGGGAPDCLRSVDGGAGGRCASLARMMVGAELLGVATFAWESGWRLVRCEPAGCGRLAS